MAEVNRTISWLLVLVGMVSCDSTEPNDSPSDAGDAPVNDMVGDTGPGDLADDSGNDCTPPEALTGEPLPDDTAGLIATACAGVEGRAVGDRTTYDLVAADWLAIVEYELEARVAGPSAMTDAVTFLRVRVACDVFEEVLNGSHEAFACATQDLAIESQSSWDDDDCILILAFSGLYSHAVLADVLGRVAGVERVYEFSVDDCHSQVRATLESDARYYQVQRDTGDCAPNYFTYRMDDSGPQLIAESCAFPEAGYCLVGTGPTVVPSDPPDEWVCVP